MRIEKKTNAKYSKDSPLVRQKSAAAANIAHLQNSSVPRPNVRKNPVAETEKKDEKMLEVNPNSPFLNSAVNAEHGVGKNKVELNDIPLLTEDLSYVDTSLSNVPIDGLRIKKSTPKSTLKNPPESEPVAETFKLAFSDVEEKQSQEKTQEEPHEAGKNRRLSVESAYMTREQRLSSPVIKAETASVSAWQWAFTLRPTSVAAGIVVLFITLGFFFTFGLIVGRGMTPPGVPVPLASIVPNNDSNARVVDASILKPEDLQYAQVLRDKSVEEPQLIVPTGQARQGELVSQVMPTNSSSNAILPYPIGSTNPNVQQVSSTEAQKDIKKYDYVLRAASFRDEKSADTLRAQLEGAGLRTQLMKEKSSKTTWYYVHINYRGTAEAFQTMRDSLTKYAIRDSIVVSKKEVQN